MADETHSVQFETNAKCHKQSLWWDALDSFVSTTDLMYSTWSKRIWHKILSNCSADYAATFSAYMSR